MVIVDYIDFVEVVVVDYNNLEEDFVDYIVHFEELVGYNMVHIDFEDIADYIVLEIVDYFVNMIIDLDLAHNFDYYNIVLALVDHIDFEADFVHMDYYKNSYLDSSLFLITFFIIL